MRIKYTSIHNIIGANSAAPWVGPGLAEKLKRDALAERAKKEKQTTEPNVHWLGSGVAGRRTRMRRSLSAVIVCSLLLGVAACNKAPATTNADSVGKPAEPPVNAVDQSKAAPQPEPAPSRSQLH